MGGWRTTIRKNSCLSSDLLTVVQKSGDACIVRILPDADQTGLHRRLEAFAHWRGFGFESGGDCEQEGCSGKAVVCDYIVGQSFNDRAMEGKSWSSRQCILHEICELLIASDEGIVLPR